MFFLIAPPPVVPDPQWHADFAARARALMPDLWEETARRWSVLAYHATYLLEADEAAEWWIEVMRRSVR